MRRRGASAEALTHIAELLRARPSARLVAGAADSRPMPVPDYVKLPREKCLPAKIFDTLDPADYEPLINALG